MSRRIFGKPEWPTLGLIAVCYAVWVLGTGAASALWLPLGVVVTTIAIALFSSLQHEVLHGHPFRNRLANEALVFPALTLFVPYGRFRDTHLAHHHDPILTDPYDDPETNFVDPKDWAGYSTVWRTVRRANNSLLGRILLGPALSILSCLRGDWALARAGDRGVLWSWGLHMIGLAMVFAWLAMVAAMPVWAYLLSAYLAYGILKIRTFLEHQAHEQARQRSVIIEDKGPLALIFLNNNLHAVHHRHPGVAWYDLPALYAARKDEFLRCNGGYRFRSYAEVFRRYFLRIKDPVAHPLYPPQQ